MDLNTLTYSQLQAMFGGTAKASEPVPVADSAFWEVGQAYLIRTVTVFDTGVLVAITDKEIILKDAAWIADTGRFSAALKKCEFNEVEPFPDGAISINRGAYVDAVRIASAPRAVK